MFEVRKWTNNIKRFAPKSKGRYWGAHVSYPDQSIEDEHQRLHEVITTATHCEV